VVRDVHAPSGLDERPDRVGIGLPERCRFEAELVACAGFVEPGFSANEVDAHVPVADAENVGSHLTARPYCSTGYSRPPPAVQASRGRIR
jgi:hypothetical protein